MKKIKRKKGNGLGSVRKSTAGVVDAMWKLWENGPTNLLVTSWEVAPAHFSENIPAAIFAGYYDDGKSYIQGRRVGWYTENAYTWRNRLYLRRFEVARKLAGRER